MADTIASYNDTNVTSCEVKKTTPQSFALVSRHTYLIHYEYVPQEVANLQLFENFMILFMAASGFYSF